MALYEVRDQFAGYPVVLWEPGTPIVDPATHNYKIMLTWDDRRKNNPRWAGKQATEPAERIDWADKLAAFLADPASSEVAGIVVGMWGEAYSEEGNPAGVVAALAAARDRLPALTRLFVGDIESEESEISWITQTDLAPLLAAYPRLEHFGARGGSELAFNVAAHVTLKSLEIETGGLPRTVVQQIFAADLPALEHLELWLGVEEYGADTTVADFQPLLAGSLFPHLRYLGLRNSEIADELAVALATAPILERIEVLDLSLGTVGDTGAEALLNSPAVRRLRKLDLHHHYCSDEMIARLKGLPIEVNTADQEEADDWGGGEMHRYVRVSE